MTRAPMPRTAAPLSLLRTDPLAAAAETWLEHLVRGDEIRPELWERALLGPARNFLRRPGKRFRSELVRRSWSLAGGAAGACPIELEIALELVHAGSLIVDDIEDDSEHRRGAPTLHREFGVPVALNTGNCLYFVPFVLFGRLPLEPAAAASLYRRASDALVDCHRGQALDLSTRIDELAPADVVAVVEASTRLKTGALMKLGAASAAVAAGASDAVVDALAHFGGEVGLGLQMLDDLGSLRCPQRRDKGREDLRHARPTWPWAWLAAEVDAASFVELQTRSRRAAGDGDLDAVGDLLLEHTGERGRRRIRARLAAAEDDLRCALGDSAELAAIERELARLETSYG